MAKENGLGWALAVDDSGGTPRTISNDVTDLTVNTPRAEQDITGIDKSAHERLQLLADFSTALNGVFNDAVNMSHTVFKTIPSSSVARTVTHTISGQSLACEALFDDYALTRGAGGEFTWSTTGSLADGAVPTYS